MGLVSRWFLLGGMLEAGMSVRDKKIREKVESELGACGLRELGIFLRPC